MRTEFWWGKLLESGHVTDETKAKNIIVSEIQAHCEYERWLTLAQESVQTRTLILAMLRIRILLLEL
jgi:hypothetical protein